MRLAEKDIWKAASIVGSVFMGVCFAVSLWQFFADKGSEAFLPLRYVGICINSLAFFGFIYLLMYPTNYLLYAVVFYVYGVGNLLDNGHALGFVCVFTSCAFLYAAGVFSRKRALKIVIISVLPLFMVALQFYRKGALFGMLTVMHMLGLVFMLFLVVLIFYPRFEELKARKISRALSAVDFSEQDVAWLGKVLDGGKYSELARDYGVSEGDVKARMLELYQMLGVRDRTEFLRFYHSSRFERSDSVPSAKEEFFNAGTTQL